MAKGQPYIPLQARFSSTLSSDYSVLHNGDIAKEIEEGHETLPYRRTPRNRRDALSDLTNSKSIATNGQLSNGPRASPMPQSGPPVPNGKPTSPYNERTNPISPSAQIAAQTVSSKDPKAAAQAASDMRNVVRRKLTGYVGFANLPNQWHRKSVRKGFNFNVMVVGKYPLNYRAPRGF